MVILVKPSAKHVGAVVDTVGTAGVASFTTLVNDNDAPETHKSVLVAVTVYAVPRVAPLIAPPEPAVGPDGVNV